jgi:hypothetical protein
VEVMPGIPNGPGREQDHRRQEGWREYAFAHKKLEKKQYDGPEKHQLPAKTVRRAPGLRTFQSPRRSKAYEIIGSQIGKVIANDREKHKHRGRNEPATDGFNMTKSSGQQQGSNRAEKRSQSEAQDLQGTLHTALSAVGAPQFRIDSGQEVKKTDGHETDERQFEQGKFRSPAVNLPVHIPMHRDPFRHFVPKNYESNHRRKNKGAFQPV